MRVGPDHVRVHERGPAPRAALGRGLAHHGQAGQRIAAVHLAHEQVGEERTASRCCRPRSAPRPAPRSRSRCPRPGRGRAASGVQAVLRLSQNSPSRRRALAGASSTRPRPRRGPRQRSWRRLGAADRLEELGAGGRGLGDDVEPAHAPVRRHLAAAGAGIVARRPTRRSSISVARHRRAAASARGRGSRRRTSRSPGAAPCPPPPGPPRGRRR